jgi:hypothetical protein
MTRYPGSRPWPVIAIIWLVPIASITGGPAAAWRVIPVAVRDGHCECVLPTPNPDDKYLLVLGSLSTERGPYAITVSTGSSSGPVYLPRDQSAPSKRWAREVRALRERLDRARMNRRGPEDYPPSVQPPGERIFYLFAGEGDLHNPSKYVRVIGALKATGRRCQVYADRDHADTNALALLVAEITRTFDEDVYPVACSGRASDVDRDGRFTILLTPWLGKLHGGKVALEGFVRGSDFYIDLDAPFSNRCDMLYLNTSLKPGPHLRTILAHEYTHAVVFSEHVLTSYLPEVRRREEESWLNEALAHLAEDLHGKEWSNLDYRISAFLSCTERYGLVVPDYYAAGLWRSHGHRGAAYLFLRWCADTFGPNLQTQLIQTNLSGIRNLEVATGTPFPLLFRHWAAALALSGVGLTSPAGLPLKHLDLRQPLAGRLLCGPRLEELALTDGAHEAHVAGTGLAFLLLHTPGGAYSRLTIRAEKDAQLQVSLIRLPRQVPRLSLRWEQLKAPRSGRLVLTVHDAGVTLDDAAWERLTPTENRPEDTSFRPEARPGQNARDWFGDPHVNGGETRVSKPISLPAWWGVKEPLIFKISATDGAGRHWAACTVVGSPSFGRVPQGSAPK